MNQALLDAVVRLVRLLDTPEDISVLAPWSRRKLFIESFKRNKANP